MAEGSSDREKTPYDSTVIMWILKRRRGRSPKLETGQLERTLRYEESSQGDLIHRTRMYNERGILRLSSYMT